MMFSKRSHGDFKKSAQKVLDCRKDVATRLKHLRFILAETSDLEELKLYFDANFSQIYFIFFENFTSIEMAIKQKGFRSHKEDLEYIVTIFERILQLLPEKVQDRWQHHSIGFILKKFLHPGNSLKIRREGMRLLLLWMQALQHKCTSEERLIFACLVPGFPPPVEPGGPCTLEDLVCKALSEGPVIAEEVTPLVQPQSSDFVPDDLTCYFLEILLNLMVRQSMGFEWRKKENQDKGFSFLFGCFKKYYLSALFPSFCALTSFYNPDLAMPTPRSKPCYVQTGQDHVTGEAVFGVCDSFLKARTLFIKWLVTFWLETLLPPASANLSSAGIDAESMPRIIQRVAAGFSGRSGEGREKVESDGVLSNGELSHSGSSSTLMTECIPSILSFGNGLGSEEVACQTALVRRVLCSSQENMDFVCEVFRQAMLLPISEIIVMRSVLKVYQEWIENEQKPPFVCDNDTDSLGGAIGFVGATFEEDTETFEKETSGHEVESAEKDKEIELMIVEEESKVSHSRRHSRSSSWGRSGSYQKAINPVSHGKDPTVNFQTFLQVILTHSANVFLLEPSYEMSRLLNDQVDLCKRVLSIYRHMIMQTSMEQRTWEQLLHVLLGITENIFHQLPSEVPMQSTLAGHLASPIFQTLIVASIRASLSIPVSHKLWDRLLLALSSLTHWPELITEWTKTMETLTKVLARQVYGLDLTDLPLNKIGENRLKKQRSKALRSDAKSTSLDRSFSKSWSREQFRQGFSRNLGMTTETSLHSQRAKNSVLDMHTPPTQDYFHDDSHVGWSSEENRVPSDEHQDLWHSSSACDLQQVHQAEVNIQCDVIRPEQHQTGSLLLDPIQSENNTGHITVEDGHEKLNTSIDAWQTSRTRDDFERYQDLGLSSVTSAFNIGGGGTHEGGEKESLSMFPLEPSGLMMNQHCYHSVGGDDPMSLSDILAMLHNKGTENIIASKGGPYGVGMEKTAGHNVHHKSEELEYGNLGVATSESETMIPSRQIGIDVLVTPGSESASLTYSESSHSPSPSLDGEISQVKDSLAALDESLTSSVLHLHDITDEGETGCKTSSVMMGGAAVGWNAEVAWVLWKRVLGLLGDVNNIKDSEIHAQVFEYFCDLWETLVQIRDNLGVSMDNQTTPLPPNLIPPLTLLIPWLLKATRLPKSHRKGQMLAHRLLCKMMSSRQHALISTDLSIHLYSTLHSALLSHDQKLVSEVVKHCSPCFWAFTLPASSILVWDVLWAASCVATYPLPWAPHAEAQTLLGALVCLPNLYESMPVLHPTAGDIVPTDCEGLKDELVKLIISAAKEEHSECARCVAISSLGIWLCEELVEATNHPKILESFQVICSTLLDSNRAVAQVACDVMNTLLYYAVQLQQYQPDLSRTAVKEIASSITCLLSTAESSNCDDDKKFLASLVSTLVDWCMAVPRSTLLSESNIKEFGTKTQSSLLCFVFKVLYACVYGSHMLTWYEYACSTSWMGSGFSSPSSCSIDHRRPSLPAKTMNSAEVPRGLLVHAGRAAVAHLLTLLEHFPLADGGPALQDSLLSEQSLSKENETQRTETLESPHMQIFVLTNGSRVDTLLSVIELTQLTDVNRDDLLMKERLGLMTSGVRTGPICPTSDVFSSESHPPSSAAIVDSLLRPCHHRVRLLTRDASGKHVWDAVRLFGPAHAEGTFFPTTLLIPSCVKHECSTQVNDENRQNIPENVWQLDEPVVTQDDVLDDLLQYIGSSSPECLPYGPGVALHQPAPETHPHFSAQDEQALIETLERQRQAEHEWNIGQSADPPEDWTESQTISLQHEDTLSPFLYARILLSDLGLLEWNKRNNFDLLFRNEKLLRELRNLDSRHCRETHKIAVFYIAEGQEDKVSILSNGCGSHAFENFVAGLGWEVDLSSHQGFMGGLQHNGSNGSTSPYFATSSLEVMFHVATRMPCQEADALTKKLRHLGNDEVHVVWSEHSRDYRRGIIPTEFGDVLIVIYPIHCHLFRIQVIQRSGVPLLGPLFDGAIVGAKLVSTLVRSTAINASRALKRCNPLYQNAYEERASYVEAAARRHCKPSTFEEFSVQVFNPMLEKRWSKQSGAAAATCVFGESSREEPESNPLAFQAGVKFRRTHRPHRFTSAISKP